MSRQHDKNVAFIKSLLNKPKWYNETLVHKNWPMIKRAIKNLPDPLAFTPPTLPEYKPSLSDELILRTIYQPQIIKSNFIGLKVS
jgi:hypothetical protein